MDKQILKSYVEQIEGKLLAIASEEIADRDGDIISIDGWDLKNFKANPVLMWLHMMDGTTEPIGRANNIGFKLINGKKKMTFEPEFHEITEKAKTIKRMYDEGFLKAFSVGFKPKEWQKISGDQEFPPRYKYTKQELVEISAVAIPALPTATIINDTAKKGYDMTIVKALFDKKDLPNEEIEETKEVKAPEEKKDLEVKVGRTLSSKNEGKIRSAVTILNEVVSVLDKDSSDDKANTEIDVLKNMDTKIDKMEALLKHLIGEVQTYRKEKDLKVISEKNFGDEDLKDALRIVAQAVSIALKKAKSMNNT